MVNENFGVCSLLITETHCPERTTVTKNTLEIIQLYVLRSLLTSETWILDSTTWKTKQNLSLSCYTKQPQVLNNTNTSPHSLTHFDTSVGCKILGTGVAPIVGFSEEFTLFHILIIQPGAWELKKLQIFQPAFELVLSHLIWKKAFMSSWKCTKPVTERKEKLWFCQSPCLFLNPSTFPLLQRKYGPSLHQPHFLLLEIKRVKSTSIIP